MIKTQIGEKPKLKKHSCTSREARKGNKSIAKLLKTQNKKRNKLSYD